MNLCSGEKYAVVEVDGPVVGYELIAQAADLGVQDEICQRIQYIAIGKLLMRQVKRLPSRSRWARR